MIDIINTKVSERALDCVKKCPLLFALGIGVIKARMYAEAVQIFEQVGGRIFGLRHAKIIDKGLDYKTHNYCSFWEIGYEPCYCQRTSTGYSSCSTAIELMSIIDKYLKRNSKGGE